MQVARPDLAPLRAKLDNDYKRIAGYAGEANVKKLREMAEQSRERVTRQISAIEGYRSPVRPSRCGPSLRSVALLR
jgi:hypothetical protein